MASTAALKSYADQQAQAYGIPSEIFSGLITAESGWNPYAVSGAGAEGIAQLEPSTAPNVNRFDPFASLNYAAQLLSSYYKRFGSWDMALAAYNAGPSAVDAYGGVPPYAETQNYVKKILGGTSSNTPSRFSGGAVNVGALKIIFWAAVIMVGIIVIRGVSK